MPHENVGETLIIYIETDDSCIHRTPTEDYVNKENYHCGVLIRLVFKTWPYMSKMQICLSNLLYLRLARLNKKIKRKLVHILDRSPFQIKYLM